MAMHFARSPVSCMANDRLRGESSEPLLPSHDREGVVALSLHSQRVFVQTQESHPWIPPAVDDMISLCPSCPTCFRTTFAVIHTRSTRS